MVPSGGARVIKPLELSENIDSIARALRRKLPIAPDPEDLALASRMVSDIAEPAGVIAWAGVRAREAGSIQLTTEYSSQTFHLGRDIKAIAHASAAMLSVITLGQGFVTGQTGMAREGDPWVAYLMDRMGVIMLCRLCKRLRGAELGRVRADGWGAGPSIGPGSVPGWTTHDQKRFLSLLPIAEIDVRVDDTGTIHPFKSASAMIGVGPEYKARSLGETCSLCRNSQALGYQDSGQ